MKLPISRSSRPVLACALALGLVAACSQSPESGEIASPEPPAESASSGGFNPLRALGLTSAPPTPPATLAAGQRIRVRTTSTLSTKSNSSGEAFVGSLAEPVMDGERMVFAAGAPVRGRVSFADEGGRVKGVARIGVELTEIAGVPVSTKAYVAQAKQTHTRTRRRSASARAPAR